jgi:hypothetical protein
MRLSTKAVKAAGYMLSEPKDSATERILEGQAWDRFDALGRPSPNDRYLRILAIASRWLMDRIAPRAASQSSASGWASKIRTRRIDARMRKAGC